jgi:hypothetical protein
MSFSMGQGLSVGERSTGASVTAKPESLVNSAVAFIGPPVAHAPAAPSRRGAVICQFFTFFGVDGGAEPSRGRDMHFQLEAKLLPVLLVATALAAFGVFPASAGDTPVEVLIDQVSLVKLDRPAAEIVVGNPSIADVSVQSGKVLVLTGKSFGETNLIVLDGDGKIIISKRLIVTEPRTGLVTIYRGTARQTVNCSPYCTPPLAIGDESNYFDTIAKEIKGKQSISQSSAEGTKQSE